MYISSNSNTDFVFSTTLSLDSFWFNYVYMCFCLYVYIYKCVVSTEFKIQSYNPWCWNYRSCERLIVGAWNWVLILWKQNKHWLPTSHLSIPVVIFFVFCLSFFYYCLFHFWVLYKSRVNFLLLIFLQKWSVIYISKIIFNRM